MTEKEKRENEALKNCIQEAYGLSDEQLLAELEELEATLSDDEFVGAEERIYNKIKEREAERSSDSSEEITITYDTSTSNSNQAPIRKISKKKRWLVVGIAAALVVGAGVNTIGGNNYFLRQYEEENGIVLDSGQNIVESGDLEAAYKLVDELLQIPIIKIGYFPKGMKYEQVEISSGCAVFTFSYVKNKVYFVYEKKSQDISIGINSDRKNSEITIYNEWIGEHISIEKNTLDNNKTEYSALVQMEDVNYRIIGIMPFDELDRMVSNLVY